MTIELGVLIGLAGTIAGTGLAYLGYRRAINRDMTQNGADEGELRADISYIKRAVDDIRVDMRHQEKRVGDLTERVTRVEESAKQAHLRINELKKEG